MSPTQQHSAGHATYPGNVEHIVGEVKGPTTYGTFVVATTAEYSPADDPTRVGFRHGHADEDVVRDADGTLRLAQVSTS